MGPCGLLFPNGDVNVLAERIQLLLTDEALLKRFVDQGPDHIKQFAPEVIAGRYLRLFEAAVSLAYAADLGQ